MYGQQSSKFLGYISGTVNYGCIYRKQGTSESKLIGFMIVISLETLMIEKVLVDQCSCLGQAFVTWVSQMRRVVALSSCEVEYIASANTACQGIWLSRFLGELLGVQAPKVKLLVDNKSAIALSKNPVCHDRSKHIDTRYHFIRDCVDRGEVDIDHVERRRGAVGLGGVKCELNPVRT
jgi:hypothetical protein